MGRILFFILSVFFLYGCVTGEDMQGLMTLKSVSNSQEQQDKFLEAQEARFQKLLQYVKENKLDKGQSKKWVIAAFGEPYLAKQISNDPQEVELLMYRHPAQFFGSERVYLYFDNDSNLVGFRYEEGY